MFGQDAKRCNSSAFKKFAVSAAMAAVLGCMGSVSAQESQLTVAELKTIYLDCDRNAMRGLLGAAEIAACSIAYEELKKRAFDGDFDKFLVWSRAQNSANIAAR